MTTNSQVILLDDILNSFLFHTEMKLNDLLKRIMNSNIKNKKIQLINYFKETKEKLIKILVL
jgi:hypothetical protein